MDEPSNGDEDNREEEHGQDSGASTPESTSHAQQATKAPKDRQCPFCGQAFTSSSLGRHLDLYIKPRNPKPADGVHDVEEIRKIRGGITRRQPRTSVKNSSSERRGSDRPRTWDAVLQREREEVEVPSALSPNDRQRDTSQRPGMLNAPSWQSTGVINNLPPRSEIETPVEPRPARLPDVNYGSAPIPTPPAPLPPENTQHDTIWRLQEAADAGRAAELALREVLGSLEAARKKVEPPSLFDECDFFGLSFPGLCLAILPAPGTLFTPSPFSSPDSWSLGAPGRQQKDSLTRRLGERIREKRQNLRDRGESEIGVATAEIQFKHNAHIEAAWEHWCTIRPAEQERQWTLELLRSLAREKDSKSQLRIDLEKEKQHTRHLEAQYDRLARCQLPREWRIRPPTTVPIPSDVSRAADFSSSKIGINESDYDPETIISKWRASMKSISRAPRPLTSNGTSSLRQLYSVDAHLEKHGLSESNVVPMQTDMIMNGAVYGGVNGPMKRGGEQPRNGEGDYHNGSRITYETPPQPGTVLGTSEDGGQGDNSHHEDGDEDGLNPAFASYVDQGALAKQRQFVDAGSGRSSSVAPLSAGPRGSPSSTAVIKRPAPFGIDSGRGKAPRVVKMQTAATAGTGKVSEYYDMGRHAEIESNVRASMPRPSGNIVEREGNGAPESTVEPLPVYGLFPQGRLHGRTDSYY